MVTRLRLWLLLVVVMTVLGALALPGILFLSLPTLDGEVRVRTISSDVRIDRDRLGIPTIKGENRTDVAFATGYLHAQDRFFQMDLNRRNSAGELSALVGNAALDHDKSVRVHRFRNVAQQVVENLNAESLAILNAYTEGVNQGLGDLGSRPFEYILLEQKPKPWQSEDSFLTVFSMYLDLTGRQSDVDKTKGFLASIAGRDVVEFLSPVSTRWDAPLDDVFFDEPDIPNADRVNLNQHAVEKYTELTGELTPDAFIGSNNFAVSGDHSNHDGAIVENDMHLGLRVPTVWYRAQFVYQDSIPTRPETSLVERRVNGLTLPGTPFIVVGTNRSVAWGFTNSNGDWVDWVDLEITDDGRYLTPDGPESFETQASVIEVKDGDPVTMETRFTRWGPVIASQYDGSLKALRWTAHNPEATNGNLYLLEKAEDIYEAINMANISGIPPQNFTVGDSKGNVGWSIAGRIPQRSDVDSTYPLSWQQASDNWKGWLGVDDYPMVLNPASGRIWTANARAVGDLNYKLLGNGGYATGTRAFQIRESLMESDKVTESDLLTFSLDTKSVYIDAWRKVALDALAANSGDQGNEGREAFKELLENWSGHALADDAGYRMGREFQDVIRKKVLIHLGRYFLLQAGREQADIDDVWLEALNREESSVLRLLEQQPENWLPPVYSSWNALILEAVDEVVLNLGGASKLSDSTWGERNIAQINHPLSGAVPLVGQWLNMPAVPLNGDSWSPLAQRPSSGVSERMVVSPGREEDGIMHIPGGQSGHPLSSFYQAGFQDWLDGKPSPLLPGETRYTLHLKASQ